MGLKGHCLEKKHYVIIFLKQITFISEYLLENSNGAENYSVTTGMVPFMGVNKVKAKSTTLTTLLLYMNLSF